uniref:TIR domain-containing protein n=1 Tax=Branchiostoma floridae TaxID=7739 RepID=C3YU72_BRAFL|eukprot:XP_002600337.1 hypothetical protein BRAFLDRAFT_66570 [Branchiostoma floridae]
MAASHQCQTVFICHAGESKPFVRQLVDRLKTDGLEEDQIFFDERSLDTGDELDSIVKVIESPSLKLFVFVVSKYCFDVDRTWIRTEWEAALENNKQIFPIWLDDNNDDFKAFGNLVRKFSNKLRKMIAQRVNPQEISTTLSGLSEKICSLVCGDQPSQQRPTRTADNAVVATRQNIMPEVLPAKLTLEFVQKSKSQLLDKADALFDKEVFKDEESFKKAEKLFDRYKATIESIIGGCFIFNLRFFQPCNVDEFYHDHFRLGPESLSTALTNLLITDEMQAAAGGEELMVRVEVRYDDYIRVRRQLCVTGILKATSVDNLSTLVHPSTERSLIGSKLESLDLAITGTQDSSVTEWAAHPCTKHLTRCVKWKSKQVVSLTRGLEIQQNIVRSLHHQVSHLNKENEKAQQVVMSNTEEMNQFKDENTNLKAIIEALMTAKTKVAVQRPEENNEVRAPNVLETAPSGVEGGAPAEPKTPSSGVEGGAPEEPETPLSGVEGGAPAEPKTPSSGVEGGAAEEPETPLSGVEGGAPEEPETPLSGVEGGAPEEPETPLSGVEGGAPEEPETPLSGVEGGAPEEPETPLSGVEGGAPEEPEAPLSGVEGGAPEEPETPLSGVEGGAPEEPETPLSGVEGGAPEEPETPLSGVEGGAPEEPETPLSGVEGGAPEEPEAPLSGVEGGAAEELETPLSGVEGGAPEEPETALVAHERLEMAKHQPVIQDFIVKSLQKQVARLMKKDEEAQNVLMSKTEENQQLKENNKSLQALIESLLGAKKKAAIPSPTKEDAPMSTEDRESEEPDFPLLGAYGGASEEFEPFTPLWRANKGLIPEVRIPPRPGYSEGWRSFTVPAGFNTFLDHCRPGDVHSYISQHLQTDESFRDECSDVVDRVASFFKRSSLFTVTRFIKGGSLGKGTAIKSKSDIDCVMFISELPPIDSDDYYRQLQRHLERMERGLIRSKNSIAYNFEVVGRTSYAVQLRVKTQKRDHESHDVDLLLATDLLGPVLSSIKKEEVYRMMGRMDARSRENCSAALVELQRDFVKKQPAEVKNLIRLVKMWKPLILDPANPYNNVADRCRNWDAVAEAAKKTLQTPFFSRY